jgi:hypothetical protein
MLIKPLVGRHHHSTDGGSDVSMSLTPAQMQSVLQEAIKLWEAAGVPAADVPNLANMTVKITPLPSPYLAWTYGDTISISPDAAGYGWYVNPAVKGVTVPDTRVDLLTVLSHEIGHILGYGDTGTNNVMEEHYKPGQRFLPGSTSTGTSSSGRTIVPSSPPTSPHVLHPRPKSPSENRLGSTVIARDSGQPAGQDNLALAIREEHHNSEEHDSPGTPTRIANGTRYSPEERWTGMRTQTNGRHKNGLTDANCLEDEAG